MIKYLLLLQQSLFDQNMLNNSREKDIIKPNSHHNNSANSFWIPVVSVIWQENISSYHLMENSITY